MKFLKDHWIYIVLIFIFAFGVFFRFWSLADIPPGIYPDEAKNANDAIETLITGDYKVFYPENNGREGLFIWLIAWSYKLLGVSVFALKFPGALMGSLTIIGTYLATRELLLFAVKDDGLALKLKLSPIAVETAALLASGFLATSFWHINFSRIGFRAIMVPFLLSFAIYWTFKTLRTKNLLPAVAAGICWGLGFYTYIAFRFALFIPFIVITLAFVAYLIGNPPKLTKAWLGNIYKAERWWRADTILVTMIATMLPMLLYFYNNPENFMSRVAGVSVFGEANPIMALMKSFGLHLQMLFFVGDGNWRHNFAGEAQLMLPIAILFALGVVYSCIAMVSEIKGRNWNSLVAHLSLLAGFVLMIMPAALTIEGVPHALRSIGLMPFVFIYAAMGFLYIIWLTFPHRHHREEIWPFIFGTALIIILLLSSFQFTHYFAQWGRNENVQEAFTRSYVEIGNYFNSVGNDTHKYLIVNEDGAYVTYPENLMTPERKDNKLPVSANTTLFIQRTHAMPVENTTYILPDEFPLFVENAVLAPLIADDNIKEKLRTFYPQGVEIQLEHIWVYQVK